VASRLFAVIVAALLMGLVFGGLRVADSEESASQLSRTQELATLTTQLVTLVNDLQNERDTTLLLFSSTARQQKAEMAPLFARTDAETAVVSSTLSHIDSLPANIRADVTTVLADISSSSIQQLHDTLSSSEDDLGVVTSYGTDITDMITLADQVGQGVSDASLASDVQALYAIALAEEQVSQQRALLNSALSSPVVRSVTYVIASGVPVTASAVATVDPETEQALATAYRQQYADIYAFNQVATPAQVKYEAADSPAETAVMSAAEHIEEDVFTNDDTDYLIGNGTVDTGKSVPGSQLVPSLQGIALLPTPAGTSLLRQGLATWDAGMGDKLAAMQSGEMLIASNIADRASQLYESAHRSALTSGIVTVVVLLAVLLAALAVARSLVVPLRRLSADALDVASVQLPKQVRLLSESPDAAAKMEVVPINVNSLDEIGQVARAFDRVHFEAVRLAGEQAVLRSSFNAMFVNLSRRSQTLIERLARVIDGLEQNEEDPDRLGSLFSMDHMVARMRRNSENLLLLAGHKDQRKWSEPVPLTDVARAAISEIEHFRRVTLVIPPGISIVSQAVSDVVHLLAELIENATVFSRGDAPVLVSMHEAATGGVVIEVTDKGIGASDTRLREMNERLDNPSAIDVSDFRHMGLLAVARLADRNGIRVRLRPAAEAGLSALVWLPDSVIQRTSWPGTTPGWPTRLAGARRAGGGAVPAGQVSLGNVEDQKGSGPAASRTPLGWFRGTWAGTEWAGPGDTSGPSQEVGIIAGPVVDDQSLGLPVRVPGASLVPGGDVADGEHGSPRPPRQDRGLASKGMTLAKRSPEQARNRLAGFQRGTLRAESQSGPGGSAQAPSSGEGT
jgi:signal transduction histidine kinase